MVEKLRKEIKQREYLRQPLASISRLIIYGNKVVCVDSIRWFPNIPAYKNLRVLREKKRSCPGFAPKLLLPYVMLNPLTPRSD